MNQKEPKVIGIGGVFFKTNDPKETKEWYQKHLGLVTDQYGSLFEFRNTHNPEEINYLQWSPFQHDTDYFGDSGQDYMINYRVQNMERLVDKLKAEGVTICDDIAEYEYGKFVHILDANGIKIELWEPVDQVFTDMMDGKTTK
ncbi:VOC family protein [Marinoscillum sp.]|uniref:VOC family protein n=1 Tax=Marinoscillum sp. TaxID=2024838 RepID=UPI003BA84A83